MKKKQDDSNKGIRCLKLGILAVTLAILFYGLKNEVSPFSAFLLVLIPTWIFIGILADYVTFEEIRSVNAVIQCIRAVSFEWYLLPAAVIASYFVAQVALSQRESYWSIFFIWVITITLVFVNVIYGYLKGWNLQKFLLWAQQNKWEIIGIVCLTGAAFVIRIINLETVPYPFSGDESTFAMYALDVNAGVTKNMFSGNLPAGYSTLYFFFQAPFHYFFSLIMAARMPSVLIATLTIPFFYIFIRQLWGRLIAFAATAYLVGYHFHLHYSRINMNNIADPLLAAALLLFAWFAVEKDRKSDFVLLGLSTGFLVYFYVGARLIPLVVLTFLLFSVIRQPSFLKRHFADCLLALMAFSVVSLPLGMYWMEHPSDFMNRLGSAGVFNSGWFAEQVAKGQSQVSVTFELLKKAFLLFGFEPEQGVRFYTPPIPLIDKLSLIPFLVGLAYMLIKFWEPRRFLFLVLFLFSVVLGGAFILPHQSHRLLASIPAVCVFVAIGLYVLGRMLSFGRNWILTAFVILGISVLVIYNVWFYFGVYAPGEYYADGNTRIADHIDRYVESLPENTQVFFFGHPLMYWGHPALLIRARDRAHYDFKDSEIYPSVPDEPAPRAFIFYPNWRRDELEKLQIKCPGGILKEVNDEKGRLMFMRYLIENETLCLPDLNIRTAGIK